MALSVKTAVYTYEKIQGGSRIPEVRRFANLLLEQNRQQRQIHGGTTTPPSRQPTKRKAADMEETDQSRGTPSSSGESVRTPPPYRAPVPRNPDGTTPEHIRTTYMNVDGTTPLTMPGDLSPRGRQAWINRNRLVPEWDAIATRTPPPSASSVFSTPDTRPASPASSSTSPPVQTKSAAAAAAAVANTTTSDGGDGGDGGSNKKEYLNEDDRLMREWMAAYRGIQQEYAEKSKNAKFDKEKKDQEGGGDGGGAAKTPPKTPE